MRISELVTTLQEIQKQHGDLTIWHFADYFEDRVDYCEVRKEHCGTWGAPDKESPFILIG